MCQFLAKKIGLHLSFIESGTVFTIHHHLFPAGGPINGIKVLMRSTRHSLLHPKKNPKRTRFLFCASKKWKKKKNMWGPSGYGSPPSPPFFCERRRLQSVFLQHVGMCHHSTGRDDTPGSMKFGAAKDNRIFKSSNPTSFESNPEDLPMKKANILES